mgnify:FL=1
MRIVIADDSALLREGVAGLLARRGHDIVGKASDAEELSSLVDASLPDLIITDVRMPPTMRDDGLTAALALRERHGGRGGFGGGVNVMVLSQYVAPAYARELLADSGAGGTGYLLKDRVAEVKDFVTACETVAAGGVVIDPEVATAVMQAGAKWLTALSPREREVLELMAEGLSNAQIARRLTLSGAAVAKHVANIFTKLGLTPDEENRRVRAILMYLAQRGPSSGYN